MPPGNEICLGLLGTGRWGNAYLKTIERIWPDGFVRISDVVGSGALPTASIKRWNSVNEMLLNSQLSGVIIATPANVHFEVAQRVLDQGLPTLVEKPICLSLAETAALFDRALKDSVTLRVGMQHLHSLAIRRLSELCGERGIRSLSASITGPGPVRDNCNALWDYGPHDVGILWMVTGAYMEPASLEIRDSSVSRHKGQECWLIRASLMGVDVAFHINNGAHVKTHTVHVEFADGGTAVWNDFAQDSLVVDGCSARLRAWERLPLDLSVEAFVADIAGAPTHLSTEWWRSCAIFVARSLEAIAGAAEYDDNLSRLY